MPLFSVITINYNNREGLEKTMDSVLKQSFPDFEYIVIDGGSGDGSADLIRSRSSRLSHWVSEKDGGIYEAMNKGIDAAKGTYCLFLNSGDCLLNEGVLQKVADCERGEEFLYGELVFDDGQGATRPGPVPDQLNMEYLFGNNIWHPATFIRRDLFERFGKYKEQYRIAADYDFFFYAIGIKKCTTRKLSFPVSRHLTDGLSTRPENLEKVNKERDLIHRAYLKPDLVNKLNRLTTFERSNARRLLKWLEHKPLLKQWAARLYTLLR